MEYRRDYQSRNNEKITIEQSIRKKCYPKPRQVWYMKLGVNIGHEADWK